MTVPTELRAQIDQAFDYRGHVTVTLQDGSSVEGYLFNRDHDRGFVELMIKNSEERRRLEIAQLKGVTLTGEDCAAGKSYEDYQKAQKASAK